MPTIIGYAGMDLTKHSWGKRLVNLIRVIRTDGAEIRFTESDTPVTTLGMTFNPAELGALSGDARQFGFKPSEQQIFGMIDGTNIRIADLNGGRYRGAKVHHYIVDARLPHILLSHQVKTLSQVKFTPNGWSARIRGMSQRIDQSRAGRFAGTYSPVCPYLLGGPFCKKDISSLVNPGIQVTTVVSSRSVVETSSARWRASYADDFFRDGEIEWLWSTPQVTGTTTAIMANPGTLTDATKSWTVNEHVGKHVRLLDSAGGPVKTNGAYIEYGEIIANTATTLTFVYLSLAYASGTNYDICGLNANAGVITPVAYYANTNRKLTLFLPTPSAISVGDSGIARPGCNGLFSTCSSKYDNAINHGGTDVDAPTAGEIIKTPEDS